LLICRTDVWKVLQWQSPVFPGDLHPLTTDHLLYLPKKTPCFNRRRGIRATSGVVLLRQPGRPCRFAERLRTRGFASPGCSGFALVGRISIFVARLTASRAFVKTLFYFSLRCRHCYSLRRLIFVPCISTENLCVRNITTQEDDDKIDATEEQKSSDIVRKVG
jgi:hypothetical protein